MSKNQKERIEQYINTQEIKLKKKRVKQEMKLKEKRAQELISRGLYDLEFSEEPKPGFQYSYEHNQYIKKVPFDVTDEEYKKITKVNLYNEENGFPLYVFIKGFAIIIFIVGFLIGILSPGVMILCWFITLLLGILLLALSKIIELLEAIKKNISKNNLSKDD